MTDGWRFQSRSPRFYDDVLRIIESDSGAEVYFGEALTYERGAAVALWRIRAVSFGYGQCCTTGGRTRSESNRLLHFYLYIPPELKYPALDLREHSPADVEAFIKRTAPTK